jgi:hypothetical protein
VAAIETAEVVGNCIQVVNCVDTFRFAVHLYELLHVKPIDGEVNRFVYLLLLANLRVGQIEEAGLARLGRFLGLEPLDLDDEDLGHLEQLKLLVDVSVLLTLAAIPLVIVRE